MHTPIKIRHLFYSSAANHYSHFSSSVFCYSSSSSAVFSSTYYSS
ncbi:hypothetical protein HID58_007588 [Brassica napus]|uniref:Uncharacterized protein n=1 Tax=Brassica napus TaxID=3708 RepID=A0ABQ8EEL6_BRANA|nr:hypothetical protein HID58_007588 [Brassica napus]